MKVEERPEYVASSVHAHRQALSGQTPDLSTLQAVFSRSGFTDGYLTGRRDLSMFGIRRKEDVTSASGVFSSLQQLYHKQPQHIPVDMHLTMQPETPTSLRILDNQGHDLCV
ncbi:MAG: U32 family peptidase, partial [Christensenellales bacterium]